MSIRKIITTLILALALVRISMFAFNYYIDVYEEVTPSVYGKIVSFEGDNNEFDFNYVKLEIETDSG